MKQSYLDQAMAIQERMIEYRRWLHRHPELGFDLHETIKFVEAKLKEIGISAVRVGKCGLMAEICGKPGKTILLRSDMDALPIQEQVDLEFASSNDRMHACGHDLHISMLLGAAQLLYNHRSTLTGSVRLIFQPAEETLNGAKDMIAGGVLEGVNAALMIHVSSAIPIPTGTLIVAPAGISAPAAAYFKINIQGRGCHGAAPHNGVDALNVAGHVLIALQELIAREVSVDTVSVLTVGKMGGGTAGNVISDTAFLEGTVRSMDDQCMKYLKQRIEDISRGIAHSFRADAQVTFTQGCPTLKNDPQLCESFLGYLVDLFGEEGAISASQLGHGSGGGSEDFAFISQQVPSVMLSLAAGEPEKGYTYPLHHPMVRFDESALPYGAAALAQIATEYLSEPGP